MLKYRLYPRRYFFLNGYELICKEWSENGTGELKEEEKKGKKEKWRERERGRTSTRKLSPTQVALQSPLVEIDLMTSNFFLGFYFIFHFTYQEKGNLLRNDDPPGIFKFRRESILINFSSGSQRDGYFTKHLVRTGRMIKSRRVLSSVIRLLSLHILIDSVHWKR